MPQTQPCPHCGAPMPVDKETLVEMPTVPIGGEPPAERVRNEEPVDVPPIALLAPGSQDDHFPGPSSSGDVASAEPDPILGAFVTPSSSVSASASALLEHRPRSRSGEGFPAIDLGSRLDLESPRIERDSRSMAEAEEDYEPEMRRTPWGSILLASYASAITLGLAWTLMKDRARQQPRIEVERPPAAVVVPESARQAGLSRRVEPPEPILGHHYATMGQTLRVGSLEITPVDLKRQSVMLRRANPYSKDDRKEGGKGALILRLRLKNTTNDATFAPLDQAYLRERGKAVFDTFVETASGERVYPFPLALDSELSIVGQDFDELRPGESRVVSIASAPDAPPASAGPFTWRVRLRTGIIRTDVIGLRCTETPPEKRPEKPSEKPITKPSDKPISKPSDKSEGTSKAP